MRELSWTPDLTGASGPKYKAIADAIMQDVESGALKPGAKLPPQRELAWHLGVTVGTVTRGYREAELLGAVAGEVGRGTYVRATRHHNRRPDRLLSDWHTVETAQPEDPSAPINMHFNFPPPGREEAATRDTLRHLADSPVLAPMLAYKSPAGEPDQSTAAIKWIEKRGLNATQDQVVTTAGAHNGILVTLASLAKPGARILTESLCYPGLLSIARMLGLELIPVAMDEEGLAPDALQEALQQTAKVAAIYCVPTLQNPTNRTMSENRRIEIAAVARTAGVPLIEDDIFGMLPEEAPGALTRHYPEGGFYVTSISKTLSPGLRVGFVKSPEQHRDKVAAAVRASAWMASPLTVGIAADWIMSGEADAILAERRQLVKARHARARAALDGQTFDMPDGALHAWLHLPEPWRASQFVAAASEADVVLSAAHAFTIGRGQNPHAVRVCLGPPSSADRTEDALRRLSQILETQDPLKDVHVM